MIISGERQYREYPLEWVLDHLRGNGYRIVDYKVYPINWGVNGILKQLAIIRNTFQNIQKNALIDDSLYFSLQKEFNLQAKHLEKLVNGSPYLKKNGVCFGMDYVVTAETM
eukprot:TRINITY_DN1473_c0_g2_i1.p1 TRINITY_DN1473_c0_g2~~TRINITY_DN1473_c0_g2_i1.p1  ORF type:complete len:111 (+),score=9.88 TRINITY_DN1473_c0_g2_i1:398-730(+)